MRELLEGIHDRTQENPDREESEVTDVFVEAGFFSWLNYDGIGVDVRSEKHIVGQNRPDYFAKDDYGNVVFVIEFKKPSLDDDLASHQNQLWERYVKPLRADYGILTDGEELILYERGSRDRAERRFRQSLDEFTAEQIETLGQLQKPELTLGSKTELGEYFEAIEPVSLGVQTDGEPIGRREFFDTFRLERGTLFYRMLERTYELIEYRLKHGGSDDFLRDAYEFWNEYYAADPSWYDLPSEWREIAGSASNKQKVMFAVETVQSILGRLMLAKACEDYDFPNIDVSEFVEQQTRDYRGNVSHVAYVEVTSQLMDQLRQELVESVFEQDLYYWWNTLAEDTRTLSDAELHDHDWPTPVERFGAGFAEFIVAIARFDFSTIHRVG